MTGNQGQLPAADGELWALVEALVDGTATAAERDRLDARLRADLPAQLFYVAYLDLHADLQWQTRGQSVLPEAPRRPVTRRFFGPLARAAAVFLALAGALLAVVLVRFHGSDDGEPPDLPETPAGSVAVLIGDGKTTWDDDMSLPTETGSALPPGRLKLKAGVVAVAFRSGGELLLEGPAELDVRAPDRAFLHRGKLTAKVPDGAPAFRVSMPEVVVTDLGGECGLLRDEAGHTEVHVFEGQVDADPTGKQGQPLPGVRLAKNAGARVDTEQQTLTPVPLNEQAFAKLRPDVRVIDAAVRSGQFAGRNFGTTSRLMVKNSIADYTWETYVCFDLSGIKGRVGAAQVRLFPVRVGQPFANAAALVGDNRWGETTITWDNKPASGPAFATWTVTEGLPVDLDVTRFVQEALAGDKKLSLRVFAPEFKRYKNFVEYGSRKGEAETRPQLLITTLP
jgi:ferric-dicitrate binding protein FerR (iron transport regulator)